MPTESVLNLVRENDKRDIAIGEVTKDTLKSQPLPLASEKMAEKKNAKRTKPKTKKHTQSSSSITDCATSPSTHGATNDSRTSLQDELEWCISQIEIGLLRPNISGEQKKEAETLFKKLSSPKTPIPRKRQLMHINFGNYRLKMKECPISALRPQVCQSAPTIRAVLSGKENLGTFYRESQKQRSCPDDEFKFDFNISNSD